MASAAGACTHTRARHSHSHVSLIVGASFLPSSIFHRRSVASSSVLVCACRSVALVLSGAVGVVTRLGTHAWLQRGIAAGARARAHARLLRSPCSLGRSYCRKSSVCLLLSLVAAKSSLARARVFVEFLLCILWLSRVRVRGHARAPACVIPCSSGVVGLVVYHRLCVQTVVACSRSCRRVGVGVSSGSCLAVSARHLGLSGASSLALVCSLCSLGRASWCGRSWVGIDVVCARPHPPSAIARVSGGSGVGLVVSREPRVPALCGICTRGAVWSLGGL